MRISVVLIALVTAGLLVLEKAPGSHASTGDVRADFQAPPTTTQSGRGIAFDGDHLYWTSRVDTRIFKLDASGSVVGSPIQTDPAISFRGLAWDGGQLWGRVAGASGEEFYTVDRNTGDATLRFEVDIGGTASGCGGDSVTPAGLAYDFATGTLWATGTHKRTIYNLRPSDGTVVRSFDIATVDCASGISTNNEDLWLHLATDPTLATRRFRNYSFVGTQLPGSITTTRVYVDGEFDPITFAPACVMWATSTFQTGVPSRIIAVEVPCSSSGYNESHYGSASSKAAPISEDPVNLAFGNFTYQHTDVSVPTRGLPLEFSRSYNSANPVDGPLGFGWTHNYDMRLLFDGTNVIVVNPDGRRDRYLNASGSYLAPPDVDDTLVLSGGVYTLTRADQTRYLFGSAGVLESIKDRNGDSNTLSLSYFASGPDVGRLQAVTDLPSGRALSFTWSSGRISSVSHPLPSPAVPVSFTYSAAGDLQTVNNVAGLTNLATYGYATGHLLETVTDANANVVVKNCYTAQKVTKQFAAPPTAAAADCSLTHSAAVGLGLSMTQFLYNSPSSGHTTEKNSRGYDTVYKFDNFFRTTQVTDANNGVTAYQYDARSNVICETDPNGGKTASVYDERSRLVERIDAENTDSNCALESAGTKTTYTYNPPGNPLTGPLTETDPLSRQTEYRYDAVGNPTRAIRRATPAGAIVQLTCFQIDAFGQTTAAVESTDLVLPGSDTAACTGNKTLFGYDASGNQTCQASARHVGAAADCATVAKKVIRAYDSGGRLTSTTDELSHVTSVLPDPFGNPLQVTDNLGNRTVYEYDAKGNLKRLRDANRQQAAGPAPELLATDCGPDGAGNGVDEDGDLAVDDGCWSTVYSYDRADRLIRVVESAFAPGANPVTTIGYDLAGNRTSQTTANRQQAGSTSEADVGGACGPLGTGDGLDQDGPGGDGGVNVVDDGCPSVRYEYDVLNRVVKEIDALKRQTVTAYDANGNVVSRTDANHGPAKLTADPDPASPEAGPACGNPPGTGNGVDEDVDGVKDDGCPNTTFTYDALNRLQKTEQWHQGVLLETTDPEYDAVGNRVSMLDATGTTRYSYDAMNRLLCVGSAVISVGSCPQSNTGYRYDNRTGTPPAEFPGQRTKVIYPLYGTEEMINKEAVYEYDASGNMTRVTDWLGNATAYQWKDNGPLSRTTYPGGFTQGGAGTVNYNYDAADRVNKVTHSLFPQADEFIYTVDAAGNRTQYTTTNNSTPEKYTYDALHRLTNVEYQDGAEAQYTYDALGNRLNQATGSGGLSYDYDAASQLTRSYVPNTSNETLFTYDTNGNTIKRISGTAPPSVSGENYHYDGANRLRKIVYAIDPTSPPSNPRLPCLDFSDDGQVNLTDLGLLGVSYNKIAPDPAYDAFVDVNLNGSVNLQDLGLLGTQYNKACPRYFKYDGDGLRASYKHGKFVASYVWDVASATPVVLQESRRQIYTDDGATMVLGSDVPLLKAGGVSGPPSPMRYVYGVGLVASIDGAGEVRYQLPDALGSVQGTVLGSTKTIESDYNYEAFGLLRGSPAARDTFTFAGEQFDSRARQGATGLQYLRARYYDPSIGRFLTADPLTGAATQPQTLNRYAYALNNPTNRTDPTGLASEGQPCPAASVMRGGIIRGVDPGGCDHRPNQQPSEPQSDQGNEDACIAAGAGLIVVLIALGLWATTGGIATAYVFSLAATFGLFIFAATIGNCL